MELLSLSDGLLKRSWRSRCSAAFTHSSGTKRQCGADEPRVEWVVKHRLVGTPAVRIVVDMLLNLEDDAFLLHLHAKHDVEVLSFRSSLLVVFAIHIEFRSVCIL